MAAEKVTVGVVVTATLVASCTGVGFVATGPGTACVVKLHASAPVRGTPAWLCAPVVTVAVYIVSSSSSLVGEKVAILVAAT